MLYELSPFAVKETQGRIHGVTNQEDFRSPWRRDVGRILYSRAFRRLALKTQVFSPIEGDHFRNRLTHTLETTQIATHIAEHLRLNRELTEAIALAHDLGHPPFGHQGEEMLDELMKEHGGFDHNFQNIRIVTLIEIKSDHYPGLNLTWETLAGIAKSASAKKFLAELYRRPIEDTQPSLEARIADLADEMAYTVHDLDDYVRYHRMGFAGLKQLDLAIVQRNLPPRNASIKVAMGILVRNLVNLLVTSLLKQSQKEFERDPLPETREDALKCLTFPDDIAEEYRELRHFLRTNMYHNENLKGQTVRGCRVLKLVFERLIEERNLQPNDERGYQKLCDYVSGMTDRYLLRLFKSIYLPREWGE